MKSLKYTFTLWSVLLIVFLATLISIATYILGSRKISDHFKIQMKTVVKIVAMEIDNFLISHGNIAETLAHDIRTIQSIRKGKPIASTFYQEIHKRYGIYENIFIFPNIENPTVIADSISGKTHGYGSISLERDDLLMYRNSAVMEKVAIGKAKKSPITGETVIVLATSIRDQGGIIRKNNISIFQYSFIIRTNVEYP
ncbi:PDC sensor domain-containing protein [Leptospira limi]|uniref:Adenylate/guanylate cyclase domain-containing protein n=1 Tax=Leptospira limi TaxID=2950023 RepID=A0ABT3LWP4_9LEPT|nr:hypothetical protein [Leptospira limi]MCW7462145.1 hypothetical protein [Leptospira limi]